ncbi:MAG: hypothetical protein H6627_07975 [Calditrichae bacterium]|nr:hypothetical protein [Calditrichia bacterium]
MWDSYREKAEIFMGTLEDLQEKMLNGQLENLREEYAKVYSGFASFVKQFAENLDNSNRLSREFLFKKQSKLILRNLDTFFEQNASLYSLSQPDLLKLFEKQYKLKQILRKQISDLTK